MTAVRPIQELPRKHSALTPIRGAFPGYSYRSGYSLQKRKMRNQTDVRRVFARDLAQRCRPRHAAAVFGDASLCRSTIRIIQQLLQPVAERWRQAGGPGGVNQSDADHISKVRTVLVPVGGQFHPHESFEAGHLKCDGSF